MAISGRISFHAGIGATSLVVNASDVDVMHIHVTRFHHIATQQKVAEK